jgi:hypothetical protein
MEGITLQEVRVLCHHKLFTLEGAWVIDYLGFKMNFLKAISFIFLLIFVLVSYGYLSRLLSRNGLLLFYFLLFACPLVIEYSFVYRPEIQLMTLGFAQFLLLKKIFQGEKSHNISSFGSGLLAGLAFATHLNGVIFFLSALVLILGSRIFSCFFIYLTGFALTGSVYFFDYRSLDDIQFFIYQVSQSPLIERSEIYNPLNLLQQVLDEHLRFFHGHTEIALSAIFILSLIILGSELKKHRFTLHYLLLSVLFLALFSANKTNKYLLLFLPYMLIFIVLAFEKIYRASPEAATGKIGIFKAIMGLFILVQFGFGIMELNYFISRKNHDLRFAKVNRRIFRDEKSSCRIVAPMEFIFFGMEKFAKIQSELLYTELKKSNPSIYGEGFLKKTKDYSMDYIMVSDAYIDQLGLRKISAENYLKLGFRQIYESDNILIFKNMESECAR